MGRCGSKAAPAKSIVRGGLAIIGVLSLGGCSEELTTSTPVEPRPLLERPIVVDPAPVHQLAARFLDGQFPSGPYSVGTRVQSHLKADIGMALAADATNVPHYAESALRDLRWVIEERLERDGGLRWDDQNNPHFFEVHQHWFLIASQLVQEQLGTDLEIQTAQRQVWRYLRTGNPGLRDFYVENKQRTGAFFAFREVHELGWFQTQAPFKGSYEIGAALWSMALLQGEAIGQDLGLAGTMHDYLVRIIKQSVLPPDRDGFFENGTWTRSLNWNGSDWSGWISRDWKYAPSMQEGAMECYRLSGRRELLQPVRSELSYLLQRVNEDGSIVGIPDAYGTERYEIGLALSILGMGSTMFEMTDPVLANRCQVAGAKVYEYAVRTFVPISNEDSAILLAGMARVLKGQEALVPLD